MSKFNTYHQREKTNTQRFLEKVLQRSNSECWEWLGSKKPTGYGHFYITENKIKKTLSAHRYAWELQNGTIPDGLQVLHKCDNPSCVNVNHLYLGTHQENMLDRKTRRRGTNGEKNKHAKIKNNDVMEIRRLATSGKSSSELSKMFSLSTGSIRSIILRKTWQHIE